MVISDDKNRIEVKEIKDRRGIPSWRSIEEDIDVWKYIVDEFEQGYRHTIHEYLNDLDLRSVIQLVIDQLSDKQLVNQIENEIKPFDDRLRKLLVETDKCVWGKPNEWRYIPPEKYWWMWGIVNNAQDELLRDLTSPHEPVQFEYYKKKKNQSH